MLQREGEWGSNDLMRRQFSRSARDVSEPGRKSVPNGVAVVMTLTQFLDYLASFTQTRQLAFAMSEIVDARLAISAAS